MAEEEINGVPATQEQILAWAAEAEARYPTERLAAVTDEEEQVQRERLDDYAANPDAERPRDVVRTELIARVGKVDDGAGGT